MRGCKLVFGSRTAFAGQYARISDDVDLSYEESGEGTPLIFIPGWTMTTKRLYRL
jgi:hypothetical protein